MIRGIDSFGSDKKRAITVEDVACYYSLPLEKVFELFKRDTPDFFKNLAQRLMSEVQVRTRAQSKIPEEEDLMKALFPYARQFKKNDPKPKLDVSPCSTLLPASSSQEPQ